VTTNHCFLMPTVCRHMYVNIVRYANVEGNVLRPFKERTQATQAAVTKGDVT